MAAGMRYGYARAFWNIVGLQFGIGHPFQAVLDHPQRNPVGLVSSILL